jgi:hypothetical protein
VLFDLHRFTTILAFAFAIFHVYILLGDQFFSFNVWELSVPFLTPYRSLPTAAGIFTLYAMVLIVVSFYVRQYIGFRAWRAVHFLTFALFAGAVYHGIAAGTDTTEPWAKSIYLITAFTTLMLVLYRVQYRMPETPTMRTVRLSAAISSVIVGILLVSATGLVTQSKPGSGSASAAQYPFLASFDNAVSGTYKQSRDATSSQFVIDGIATGDLSISLHVELAQSTVVPTSDGEYEADEEDETEDEDEDEETTESQGHSVVTTNLAELRGPATGALLCSGRLTAFDDGRMQLACEGVGPYKGVSFTVTSRIQADRNGGFNGALSGSMKRIA